MSPPYADFQLGLWISANSIVNINTAKSLLKRRNQFASRQKNQLISFHPFILIYKRGNIVYNHCGCKSIFPPLSYPFRFLVMFPYFFKTMVETSQIMRHIIILQFYLTNYYIKTINNVRKNLNVFFSNLALKPINNRWVRTSSQQY